MLSNVQSSAFSSFPNSLQFDQGFQIHSFQIRGENISSTDKRPADIGEFIYGFSYFTQKRDTTLKRGYEQRSVVFLTSHPFPAFFSAILSIFGPLLNEHGTPMLKAACHNIATWCDVFFLPCSFRSPIP
ncbi:hypothetical protein F5878DRAFT_636381 [Lentinula raphanica]|uniref:Uncharacterized protein n=1 Tax=Lentinula raphanica TaxID=153919 RepID=A0AA38NV55_9AGAR|nr:hypothetical protein F5878DRAFT_636381 [Lentinula raphanica]